ncbi:DUF6519 domain-containing protein [Actinomycetospora flava]|uniref:DUF6519 domain-containing protein n=1 Tax=Actinomycetospora flava TaxID=3129232 RepID=A0ABU8M5I6_9PSEU
MQGDFSRFTFDATKDYRSVLMQQGRVLLDADWNEQAEITAHRDEVRTRDLLGPHGGFVDEAGFAVITASGASVSNAKWDDLRLGAGAYYVDGIRCEARTASSLSDQPYLPTIEREPGLKEPKDAGTYQLSLEVWTHHVTPDDDPALREPALGGPDTTTRARTVWQARLDRDGAASTPGSPGRMVASLARTPLDPGQGSHGAESSGAEGSDLPGSYTRLENQLYRVQIHDTGPGGPRFLWSRENGSVVAGIEKIEADGPASRAVLTVDRIGRDVELSLRAADIVEITSTDQMLRGRPGYLATVGAPDQLRLPITWLEGDRRPDTLEALGRAPIVRRWEASPQQAANLLVDLEGGIQVRFSGGTYRVGDYWLVPARAVRLSYGLADLRGTLDWPTDEQGHPAERPPHGPQRHVAPLAVLTRGMGAASWTSTEDRRHLVPSLAELATLAQLEAIEADIARLQTKLDTLQQLADSLKTRATTLENRATTLESGKVDKSLLDAKGDLFVATGSDTPGRLAAPSANDQVLTADNSTVTGLKWASPVNLTPLTNRVTSLENARVDKSLLDAKGDLFVATASDTPGRLAAPSANDQVLTADNSTVTGLKWASPVNLTPLTNRVSTLENGKADKSTLTTKGDLYVRTAGGALTRLPSGKDNQVLTVNSAVDTGLAWTNVALVKIKSVDENRHNDDELKSDSELFGDAGLDLGKYAVDGLIVFSATTTANFVFRLAFSSDYVANLCVRYPALPGQPSPDDDIRGSAVEVAAKGAGFGVRRAIQVFGTVAPKPEDHTVDSGTLVRFRWAQNFKDALDTTVHAGSVLRFTPIP